MGQMAHFYIVSWISLCSPIEWMGRSGARGILRKFEEMGAGKESMEVVGHSQCGKLSPLAGKAPRDECRRGGWAAYLPGGRRSRVVKVTVFGERRWRRFTSGRVVSALCRLHPGQERTIQASDGQRMLVFCLRDVAARPQGGCLNKYIRVGIRVLE